MSTRRCEEREKSGRDNRQNCTMAHMGEESSLTTQILHKHKHKYICILSNLKSVYSEEYCTSYQET